MLDIIERLEARIRELEQRLNKNSSNSSKPPSSNGCIQMRTSLSNQLRGLLGEYGVALSTGHATLRRALPELFDREQTNELSIFFKELLESQYNMLLMIQQQIDEFDIKIKSIAQTKDVCKRVTV